MIAKNGHKYRTLDDEIIIVTRIEDKNKRVYYRYIDDDDASDTDDSKQKNEKFISFSIWEKDGYIDLSGTITVSVNDPDMGTATGDGVFDNNSEVIIEARASEGYCFERWSDGDTNPSRTVIVNGDANYVAFFKSEETPPPPEKCTIIVSVNDQAMGEADGGGEYVIGTEVTIRAKENKGYLFVRWNDGNNSNPRIVKAEKDSEYTAIFETEPEPENPKFTITVKPNDNKTGTASGSGVYASGTKVTISATPKEGFVFEHWQDGNRDNPRDIVVNSKADYIAYFRKKQCKVTVISDDNEMGSVSGSGAFAVGSKTTIKAIPEKGFKFDSWDDGNRENPRTIIVNSDVTFTAKFKVGITTHHTEEELRDQEAAYQRKRLNKLLNSIQPPEFVSQNVNSNVLNTNDKYDLHRERGREQRNEKFRKETIWWWRKKNGGLGWFTELFWWVAGVDKNLLATVNSEYNRYVGMGTVILFTAFMAAFSCSYALYYVFEKLGFWWVSLPIGIIWGTGILFIDRFISSTLNGNTFWQRIGKHGGWVRILISLILGIVISAPLSMTLFEDEIVNVMDEEKKEEILSRQTMEYSKIDALNDKQRTELERNLNLAIRDYDTLNKMYLQLTGNYQNSVNKTNDEIVKMPKIERQETGNNYIYDSVNRTYLKTGTNYDNTGFKAQIENQSAKISTMNSSLDKVKEQVDKTEELMNNSGRKRDSLERKLNTLDSLIKSEKMNADSTITNDIADSYEIGLGNRLKVFHSFIANNEKGLRWPIVLLMLLFVIIDISPVLYKCLIAKGIFESYLEDEENQKKPDSHNNRVKEANDYIVNACINRYKAIYIKGLSKWYNGIDKSLDDIGINYSDNTSEDDSEEFDPDDFHIDEDVDEESDVFGTNDATSDQTSNDNSNKEEASNANEEKEEDEKEYDGADPDEHELPNDDGDDFPNE